MKLSFAFLFLLLLSATVHASVDFKKAFSDRDACFLVSELKSGKTFAEYNPKRCEERLTPCSTFKVAAAVMAFDRGILKDELPVSKQAMDLTKKIIFIKTLKTGSKLYGKTGTGCLVGHACMDQPDKMIGLFVGVVESNPKVYVFAANATDLKSQNTPAGPRLRKTTIEILNQMELESK
jgi:beta-lactamase class D